MRTGTADDFLARLEDSGDHPARSEEVVAWMNAAGPRAARVHLHLNRAL